MNFRHLYAASYLLLFSISCSAAPSIIAHRGASGFLPEHTLEAATLAASMKPDFIEQDLVMTKDRKLIVLHDIHLETVTNVASVFPDRKRQDGRFYALDFTLDELRALSVHERRNQSNSQVFANRYQGSAHFTIATFEEQIELIGNLNRQLDLNIGFYPEIKSPAWHRSQGYDISKATVEILRKYNLDKASANIFVQCFDFAEIKRLRNSLSLKAKLVQLIAENSWGESTTDYDYIKSPEGLAEVAQYADGIGPWIPQLIEFKQTEMTKTVLADLAKKNKLLIHPYTHRLDQLPPQISSDKLLDMLFDEVGVDGVFSDFPIAVKHYWEKRLKSK
jgi:glycerophosphoryl diester phosphodiesterase